MDKTAEYTITKHTVECYKLRHPSGMYWADITIDANGSKGRIQIASDFGDYQYYWGACGNSFKEFLCQIGIDYAAGKFGADRWFDHAGTIRQYKRNVIEHRRDESIDAEMARQLWRQILNLEDCVHEQEFVSCMWEQHNLMEFYGHCPDVSKGITPQFREFWESCWKAFITELKDEKARQAEERTRVSAEHAA